MPPGLTTGLQRVRSHCARAVFSLDPGQNKTDQAKTMEGTCLIQSYVPTYMFGQQDYTALNHVVKELGGGHMPKLDLVTAC